MKSLLVVLILFNLFGLIVLQNLTNSELKPKKRSRFSGGLKFNPKIRGQICHSNLLRDYPNIPNDVDWREKGRVSPVQDQGDCNYCWAFGTTAFLEGQLAQGNVTNLSEQQLVDCLKMGCKSDGLDTDEALQYVTNHGLMLDEDYKYEEKQGDCRENKDKIKLKVTKFCTTDTYTEDDLKILVAEKGPILIGIESVNSGSDGFQDYEKGIYRCVQSPNGPDVDHAVVIVGYGKDSQDGDYWIIKNSYGEKWGEKGYMRMAIKNSTNCGVTRAVTVATVELVEQHEAARFV